MTVTLGRLEMRLLNNEERLAKKKLASDVGSAAEQMHKLGKKTHSERYTRKDGTKVSVNLREETPELRKGELILAEVEDIDFFKAYVTDIVNRGLAVRYDATRHAFERLLSSVGRRAPYVDLSADEKEHYLNVATDSDARGVSPLDIEECHHSTFAGELIGAIQKSANAESLMTDIVSIVGRYSQTLPYTLKKAFFADSEDNPNFPRMIAEKFGVEVGESVSDFVEHNTNDPIYHMLRLITIQDDGLLTDRVLAFDSDPAKFGVAEYLAASNFFEDAYSKMEKADKKRTDLEKRILEGKVKDSDLKEGVSHLLGKLIEEPQYRVGVVRNDSTFSLEEQGSSDQIVANIVVSQRGFSDTLRKLAKTYQKEGKPALWVQGIDLYK